jgi:type IV secretory pathway VirB10-like protein
MTSDAEENMEKSLLEKNPSRLVPTLSITPPITGVRRLNKKGIFVAVGIISLVFVVSSYTFNQVGGASTAAAKEQISGQGKARAQKFQRETMWYANVPDGNTAIQGQEAQRNKSSAGVKTESKVQSVSSDVPNLAGQESTPLLQASNIAAPGSQLRNAEEEQRKQLANQAMTAPLTASGSEQMGSASTPRIEIPPLSSSNYPAIGGTSMNATPDEDPNKQSRKEQFLRESRRSADPDYHQELRKEAISAHEVKAGTVIPAVMISGINSDLPGQVIAQVRENVFDTRSGQSVLIPQGARLVGLYDSQVAYGQERVLLAWNRVIFPDGSSLNLKGMPGADKAGYAGFQDQVNNRYGRIFGSAVLMSLISAGGALAQSDVADAKKKRVGDAVSEALAQQMGQTSMQMIQKNLNIQPTLEVRPGYEFNVMVTADLILPPMAQ